RRHPTQHFVFGREDQRAPTLHAWRVDPPGAPHRKAWLECYRPPLSISISAKCECYLSLKRGFFYSIWSFRRFGRTPPDCAERCLVWTYRGHRAGISRLLVECPASLAPRGQQVAMRGLRLSLSWSVTDKVS